MYSLCLCICLYVCVHVCVCVCVCVCVFVGFFVLKCVWCVCVMMMLTIACKRMCMCTGTNMGAEYSTRKYRHSAKHSRTSALEKKLKSDPLKEKKQKREDELLLRLACHRDVSVLFDQTDERIKKLCPPPTLPAHFRPENEPVGGMFLPALPVLDREVLYHLMKQLHNLKHSSITSSSGGGVVQTFLSSLATRRDLFTKIHAAMQRENDVEEKRRQQQHLALEEHLAITAPPLSTTKRIGLKTVVRTILILIRSAQRHDPFLVAQILELCAQVLNETPPLSLTDGPEFSPDVGRAVSPLIDFVRAVIMSEESDSDSDSDSDLDADSSAQRLEDARLLQTRAASIVFGVALARGSVSGLLSLIDVLLRKEQHQLSSPSSSRNKYKQQRLRFDIGANLRFLTDYTPKKRAEKHEMVSFLGKNFKYFTVASDAKTVSVSCTKV